MIYFFNLIIRRVKEWLLDLADNFIQFIDQLPLDHPLAFVFVFSFVAVLVTFSLILFFIPLLMYTGAKDFYQTTKRFYREDKLGPCNSCYHSSFLHGLGCEAFTCFCLGHIKMENLDRIEYEAKKKKFICW